MATLWILPTPNKSSWFSKIDWYLNWQMSRALRHESRKPSTDLIRLTAANNLPTPEFVANPHSPLLVSSAGRVGADQCVVIEYSNSIQEWLTKVYEITMNICSESTRVFLPSDTNLKEVTKIWNGMSKDSLNIEFTTDEEFTSWSILLKKN